MQRSLSDHLSHLFKAQRATYEREGSDQGIKSMVRLSTRALNHVGFLKIDEAFYPCQVYDVTVTGARMILDTPMELQDTFTLQLTLGGQVVRPCFLIWQEGREAGVSFEPFTPAGAE